VDDTLKAFIDSNPDPRELKRALAVQMYEQGYPHREIQAILSVSSGFISKWTQLYRQLGLLGLFLRHKGSVGYLSEPQRQAVIDHLRSQPTWHLSELQAYLEDQYQVVFASKQSYYALFQAAAISWKKSQKRNPKADPEQVKKKDKRSWSI
jgi:putative transposase